MNSPKKKISSRKKKLAPPDRLDIRTVAQVARVSIATASRVINKHQTVDPALSKRVRDAIDRLGYVPNTQARALVSGKSRLFGVIISDITNPFFPELIQGFEDAAVKVGYETLIGSTNYDPKRMEVCVARMLERKVDGVAVMTFGIEAPLLERLTSQGIPMAFIDIAPAGERFSAIRIDYDKGFHEAVQHLAILGHRRIAYIAGPGHLHSARSRLKAFQNAARFVGLPLPAGYVVHGNHTAEEGENCANKLLRLPKPPTAIMCSNDLTAFGVYGAATHAGISIPGELSIVGFDDVRFAHLITPPLTTIRMSGGEIAAQAVEILYQEVSKTEKKLFPAIETKLIVRASTNYPSGALADLKTS